MNIVKPQTIAGVMELLPEDQLAFDYIKNIIEETFLSYQFLPIDTPAIEKFLVCQQSEMDLFRSILFVIRFIIYNFVSPINLFN